MLMSRRSSACVCMFGTLTHAGHNGTRRWRWQKRSRYRARTPHRRSVSPGATLEIPCTHTTFVRSYGRIKWAESMHVLRTADGHVRRWLLTYTRRHHIRFCRVCQTCEADGSIHRWVRRRRRQSIEPTIPIDKHRCSKMCSFLCAGCRCAGTSDGAANKHQVAVAPTFGYAHRRRCCADVVVVIIMINAHTHIASSVSRSSNPNQIDVRSPRYDDDDRRFIRNESI